MNKSLLKNELRESILLSYPLVSALLAQIAMEIVSTIMIGRLGPVPLAASALGNAVFFTLLVFCSGLFSAESVLIARARGAKKHSDIRKTLLHAIYIALFLAIPSMLILRLSPYILLRTGAEPEILELSLAYLKALSWGMPGLIGYFVFREFLTAMSHTKIIMFLSLTATPVAAFFNYVFMYGKFGIQPLGVVGAGYATALMEWIFLAVLLIVVLYKKQLYTYLNFKNVNKFVFAKLLQIVKLGTPVSITMGLEVGLFTVTTLLMGSFGADSLAAHQIALQCATVAFMFPLGIAQATAIRVGINSGAGSRIKANYAGFAGLTLGFMVAIVTCTLLLIFPEFIISLFVNIEEKNIIKLIPIGVSFISVMGLFQLVDAFQVILNGALRGLKDTFVPMWLGLLSYWISGLLSGYLLAFKFGLGGVGLWWGLGIGIGVSALLLYIRYHYKIRQI